MLFSFSTWASIPELISASSSASSLTSILLFLLKSVYDLSLMPILETSSRTHQPTFLVNFGMMTYLAFCLTASLSFASLSWMPFSSWLPATSTVSFNQLSTTGQRDEAYSWIKNSTAAIKWWSIGWSSSQSLYYVISRMEKYRPDNSAVHWQCDQGCFCIHIRKFVLPIMVITSSNLLELVIINYSGEKATTTITTAAATLRMAYNTQPLLVAMSSWQ